MIDAGYQCWCIDRYKRSSHWSVPVKKGLASPTLKAKLCAIYVVFQWQFWGADDVISIILTPVMVLCFRGRLRVGILEVFEDGNDGIEIGDGL